MTLTATAIDALPKGGRLKDDRVPGLEVRSRGAGKRFYLYYRTREGIQRRPKIGDWPTLTIAQAREIARAMLAQVAAGRDPHAEWERSRGEPTMDDLARRCAAEHYSKTAWHKEAMRLYWHDISPALGKERLRAIGFAEIERLRQRFDKRESTGNLALAVVSKMLNLAERWEWRDIGSNPCRHIRRFQKRNRRRFATPAEVKAIGEVLDRFAADPVHTAGVAYIYMLMFSGARPSEILRATPAMLHRVIRDGQVYGVLRLEKAKTGARDVFLPPQAVAVIDRLPARRDTLSGCVTLPRRLWRRVRAEAGCGDLWVRDLRRTFATVALSNGVPIGQVGELLGHASVQTTKIYAKLIEDTAHATAASVADRLEGMLHGTDNSGADRGSAPDRLR